MILSPKCVILIASRLDIPKTNYVEIADRQKPDKTIQRLSELFDLQLCQHGGRSKSFSNQFMISFKTTPSVDVVYVHILSLRLKVSDELK